MYYLKYTLILLILLNFSIVYGAEEKNNKYHLGDGLIKINDRGDTSVNCVLLLGEIYCKRKKVDFKNLYLIAYPGADINWIKDLEKNYGPYTSVPEEINIDILIDELVKIGYGPLANEFSYIFRDYEIEEYVPKREETGNWQIYISIAVCVILGLILLRYKERIKWSWRNLRKSSYDLKKLEGCLKALEDKDQFVRGSAVEAIGQIGTENAVDALIKALEDKDVWVKKTAILELGKLKSRRAAPHLVKTLDDKTGFIVSAAAHALSVIGDRKSIEPMKEKLKALKSSPSAMDLRKAIQKLENMK